MKLLLKPPLLPPSPLISLAGSLKETHAGERLAQLKENFSLESGIFVVLCCRVPYTVFCSLPRMIAHDSQPFERVHSAVTQEEALPFSPAFREKVKLPLSLYLTPLEKSKPLENTFSCASLLGGVATRKHYGAQSTFDLSVRLVCRWCSGYWHQLQITEASCHNNVVHQQQKNTFFHTMKKLSAYPEWGMAVKS